LAEALFSKPPEAEKQKLETATTSDVGNSCQGGECEAEESTHREAHAGVYINLAKVSDSDIAFHHAETLRGFLESRVDLYDVKSEYSAYVNSDSDSGIHASIQIQIKGESNEVLSAMFDVVNAAECYVEDTDDEDAKSAEVHHTFSATSKWVASTSDETLV
jgi:hypothetical protein